jgi:hypothetical protein
MKRVLCVAAVCLLAGTAVAAEAVKVELKEFKYKGDKSADLFGHNEGEDKLFFYTNGAMEAAVKVPEDGEYTITVDASGDEGNNVKPKFKLSVGDEVVAKEHALTETGQKAYTFTAKLKKGEAKLAIEFVNDTFKEGEYDSNLYVHGVKLEKKK